MNQQLLIEICRPTVAHHPPGGCVETTFANQNARENSEKSAEGTGRLQALVGQLTQEEI